MQKTTTLRLATPAALLIAAGAAWAAPDALILNGNDDNVSWTDVNGDPPSPPWDPSDLPVSEDTIEVNQQLFEMREQIALDASWLGPGPDDLQLILAGDDDDWIEDLRTEARALASGSVARRPSPQAPAKRPTAGAAGKRPAAFDAESWFDTARAVSPQRTGVGTGSDNRAHTAVNTWPTEIGPGGGLVAVVPYTFSDNVVEAQLSGDPDEEQLNAIAGVANTLAVMLLLEQELPVRFVAFSPFEHDPSGILVVDSIGVGVPIPGENNSVSQIGRAPFSGEDVTPTTMTHNSWQNFPSMIRSFGFVLGLDWENRHPDRDEVIVFDLSNIQDANQPIPVAPANGDLGPGITGGAPRTGGAPGIYEQRATLTRSVDGCGFDLDSIMLIDPIQLSTGLPVYTIRPPFRYEDLNGDGVIDMTPGGPDDLVFNLPVPLFFSDCDIAELTATYTMPTQWFFGNDGECNYDLNNDEIQDGRDALLFLALFNAGDPAADLVSDSFFNDGVDQDDLDFFNATFLVDSCVGPADEDLPDDAPWFLGKEPFCSHDVNGDEVQDGEDAALFEALHAAGDPAADITFPFGVVDDDDLDAFFNGGPPNVPPFVFGACDGTPLTDDWFLGRNPDCPYDINDDGVQDGQDVALFLDLFAMGDPSADLVAPFGVVDDDDLDAFSNGAPPAVPPFTVQNCTDRPLPDDFPWFYGKNPDCPHDVDENEIQDGHDIVQFINLVEDNDPAADIVPPFGVINDEDARAFIQGDPANGIEAFVPGFCDDSGPIVPGDRPDDPFPD